jgi:UDP-N-acetylglucosamine 2-epimerase (non-hydrolysing)
MVVAVGTDRACMVSEVATLLDDDLVYQLMAQAVIPYGDGHAAQRIAAVLLDGHVIPFQRG